MQNEAAPRDGNTYRFYDAVLSERSRFQDRVWYLDNPNVVAHGQSIRWDIELGRHGRLTDDVHADWLWSCKAMYYLAMTVGSDRGVLKASTIISAIRGGLRPLVAWMAEANILSFDSLGPDEIRSYRDAVELRNGRGTQPVRAGGRGVPLSVGHKKTLLAPLRLLVAFREQLLNRPFGNPEEIADILRVGDGLPDEAKTERIPDQLAIRLFREAARWIDDYSCDLVDAYRVAADARRQSRSRGTSGRASHAVRAVRRSLEGRAVNILIADDVVVLGGTSLLELRTLVKHLEAACFILIAGFIGARISELGSLRVGCLDSRPVDGRDPLLLVRGLIYKTAKVPSPWQWVAGWDTTGNLVKKSVAVLEQLREIDGLGCSWLFVGSHGRSSGKAGVLAGSSHNRRINAFAARHNITGWSFASHQFRRTFARFVTKRDFSGLVALKQHFGHVSLQMTEYYGYWDDELIGEILDADVEQDYEALDAILASESLAGRMGQAILSRNERFRGVAGSDARKAEIERLQQEVSDEPMIVMRHEYGYCIYLQDQAACGGERWRVGVATCVGCSNFVIGSEHLPWWKREVGAHHNVIASPTFPYLNPEARDGVLKSCAVAETMVSELEENL